MLPFYEQGALFNLCTQSQTNAGYLAQFVPLTMHICPSDPTVEGGLAIVDGKTATGNCGSIP